MFSMWHYNNWNVNEKEFFTNVKTVEKKCLLLEVSSADGRVSERKKQVLLHPSINTDPTREAEEAFSQTTIGHNLAPPLHRP